MSRTAAALTLGAALVLTGCGGGNELHHVDAETLGVSADEWPLTAATAQVDCLGRGQLGIVVDGETYALNGLASATGKYLPLDPVWRDDPEIDGLKVGMGDLIQWASDQCGYP